jgi:uncharacterized protein with HEPN domain
MNDRVQGILEHMLEDAQDIASIVAQVGSFEALFCTMMARKAVVMSLLNIGELANHLPVDFTMAYPAIPWRSMIGLRNIAAHGYHQMSKEAIWNTVTVSIPELIAFLETVLRGNSEA